MENKEKTSIKLQLQIPPQTVKKLEILMKKTGFKKSTMVTLAIEEYAKKFIEQGLLSYEN